MRKRRKHISAYPRRNAKKPRVNEQIRVPEVMLVDDEGGAEKVSTAIALERARAKEMDLIEVSAKVQPPVVKIGDYGQFLYRLQKKERKQKQASKQGEMKMLRMGFRTDRHDIERILNQAKGFLADRHFVKLGLRLRGREFTNQEYAREKLRGVVQQLMEVADIEQEMKKQGNQYIVVMRPKK